MSDEARPINESIREINGSSWVIADKLLLSCQSSPRPDQTSWSDGHGYFYVLAEPDGALPLSRPLPEMSEIQKVYDAGAASAVWHVGEAFIKVKKVTLPDATREHVTLDYLYNRKPLGFDIPEVHYHAEFDGRYYIILSSIPGQTLAEAWPYMDEQAKQRSVTFISAVCVQLAAWKGENINGVDGHHLSDPFFTRLGAEKNCDPQNLLKNCQKLGMDCSSFVFYHCDLGPGNIIVNPAEGSFGIIDWETAGFVPRDWIRTKFRFSSGMDLHVEDENGRAEWRVRMARQLEEMGFPDVVHAWFSW
jgi:aminoglycoside phosphotransferase